MKHIYDMEALMHRTGISSYVELQKQGYDVVSYLKEKQERLLSKVEELQSEIDVIEEALKADTSSATPPFVNPFIPRASLVTNPSPYARNPRGSTFLETINNDACENEEDFGEDIGFDASRIGDVGYTYIGT